MRRAGIFLILLDLYDVLLTLKILIYSIYFQLTPLLSLIYITLLQHLLTKSQEKIIIFLLKYFIFKLGTLNTLNDIAYNILL